MNDLNWMERCLELARRGLGRTAPTVVRARVSRSTALAFRGVFGTRGDAARAGSGTSEIRNVGLRPHSVSDSGYSDLCQRIDAAPLTAQYLETP